MRISSSSFTIDYDMFGQDSASLVELEYRIRSSSLVIVSPAHIWTSSPFWNLYTSGLLTGSFGSPLVTTGSSSVKSCEVIWGIEKLESDLSSLWNLKLICESNGSNGGRFDSHCGGSFKMTNVLYFGLSKLRFFLTRCHGVLQNSESNLWKDWRYLTSGPRFWA